MTAVDEQSLSDKGVLRAELRALGERLRAEGRSLALCNGAFDLLHVGHLRYLQDASRMAQVLVVAVNSDASVRQLKGEGRPWIPQDERVELLCGLACVDHVLLFDEPDVRGVIAELKPDLHVKGTDYTPASIPERDAVEAYGGKVAVAGDPKEHSTSALIRRLKGEETP